MGTQLAELEEKRASDAQLIQSLREQAKSPKPRRASRKAAETGTPKKSRTKKSKAKEPGVKKAKAPSRKPKP